MSAMARLGHKPAKVQGKNGRTPTEKMQDIMTEHGSLTSQKIDWTESSQVNTSVSIKAINPETKSRTYWNDRV
jgi:hypothetical protein